MPLSTGFRLGPYEIVSLIGAGGMGEVYRARDTRLDRSVALKVLSPAAVNSPAAAERFQREARTVSLLSHPHICPLFDVGEEQGVHYLVMEHLEGESLAARLARGPLPLDQLFRCASQIAEALDHAHRRGVVHRDLKPGNVMLTPAGAKLLDFGLAKSGTAPAAPESATLSAPLTAQGAVLGTLQYMAPEQLEGAECSTASDIFAFGATLYEMATGRKAFDGKSQASVIAAIMDSTPPPVAGLVPATPPALERLIVSCLAKDPEERRHSAHDILLELKSIASGAPEAAPPAAVHSRGELAWVLPALLAVAIGAIAYLLFDRPADRPAPVVRLAIPIPADVPLAAPFPPVISRDGTHVVYRVEGPPSRLALRRLDRSEVNTIPGSSGGAWPSLSPDGQWLAFAANRRLQKLPLRGGVARTICDLPPGQYLGGDWGPDGTIVFATLNSGLWRVSVAGGAAQALTALDRNAGESGHCWPQFLPGGESILYTVRGAGASDSYIAWRSMRSGKTRRLTEAGSYPRYASSGHLVYAWEGVLHAASFDPTNPAALGTESQTLQSVAMNAIGSAAFDVSDNGTLVYGANWQGGSRTLAWRDRRGNETPIPAHPQAYNRPRLSPDGRRILLDIAEGTRNDVYIYELDREVLTRVTNDGGSVDAIWTPDGKHVVYTSRRAGYLNLFTQAAHLGGQPQRLTAGMHNDNPTSFSADGRWMTFCRNGDILVMPFEGERKPYPIVSGPAADFLGRISPDGRWAAYVANDTGRFEVYVTTFPLGRGRTQISAEGGSEVIWSRNGRELYWRQGDTLMATPVHPGTEFTVGKPRPLFSGYFWNRGGPGFPAYDAINDRFLVLKETETPSTTRHLNVVLNWFEELHNLTRPASK